MDRFLNFNYFDLSSSIISHFKKWIRHIEWAQRRLLAASGPVTTLLLTSVFQFLVQSFAIKRNETIKVNSFLKRGQGQNGFSFFIIFNRRCLSYMWFASVRSKRTNILSTAPCKKLGQEALPQLPSVWQNQYSIVK